MITRLKLENFKGFKEYTIDFSRVNVLVGGNNSGKTTIFHALQLAFWCLSQTADDQGLNVALQKTQVPELGSVPYFNMRDLFFGQKIREGGRPVRIRLTLETNVAPPISFALYPAFSRNLMIDGGGVKLTKSQFEALQALKPVFIPGTIGIT